MPSRWLLMIVCQNEMVVLNVDPPRSVGSVLILLHFNLLVNDLDDRIESALTKLIHKNAPRTWREYVYIGHKFMGTKLF